VILTYKYRIKDRSAKSGCASTPMRSSGVELRRRTAARHRGSLPAGAKPRRWASHFDLQRLCKGVGKELGLHQQSVGGVCKTFSQARDKLKHAPRFRASFGTKKAVGWIPFESQSRQIDGNSVVYLGKRYRWFGKQAAAFT